MHTFYTSSSQLKVVLLTVISSYSGVYFHGDYYYYYYYYYYIVHPCYCLNSVCAAGILCETVAPFEVAELLLLLATAKMLFVVSDQVQQQ